MLPAITKHSLVQQISQQKSKKALKQKKMLYFVPFFRVVEHISQKEEQNPNCSMPPTSGCTEIMQDVHSVPYHGKQHITLLVRTLDSLSIKRKLQRSRIMLRCNAKLPMLTVECYINEALQG